MKSSEQSVAFTLPVFCILIEKPTRRLNVLKILNQQVFDLVLQ